MDKREGRKPSRYTTGKCGTPRSDGKAQALCTTAGPTGLLPFAVLVCRWVIWSLLSPFGEAAIIFLRAYRTTVLALALACVLRGAADAPPALVTVGVLAKRGTNIAQESWQGTMDYLSQQIPGFQFRLLPLAFDEIEPAVQQQRVQFLLTNPGMYVELSSRHGVSPIATLKRDLMGQAYTEFGGVVFRRAGSGTPRSFEQLRGKRVAAVDRESLGGWIVAWRELAQEGIDPDRDFASLAFLGTHDAVVQAVLAGEYEAGVVRTDTLEQMAAEGKIVLDDVEVMSSRYCADGGDARVRAFPLRISTRLYPEWPMARLASTPDGLAERVSAALITMPPDDPAARQAQSRGWTIPRNYRSVDDTFYELGLGVYAKDAPFTFADVVRKYWVAIAFTFVLTVLGVSTLLYVLRLNRRLRASETKLRDLATHDPLTGLPNRTLFMEFSRKVHASAARHGSQFSLLFLDLDNFKPVNDQYGHAVGDRLLQTVARRIQDAIRKGDLAARVGGDEFIVLLDNVRDHAGAAEAVARLVGALGSPYVIGGEELTVGCSIGATLFPGDGSELEDLIRKADQTLYAAKMSGKNCGLFHDELPRS